MPSALGFDRSIVLSPHIGDLDTPEALTGMEQVVEALPGFLNRTPQAVAVDLHPDMHSSILGEKLARRLDLPLVQVQHHHAHALSCLVETAATRDSPSYSMERDSARTGPYGERNCSRSPRTEAADWQRLREFLCREATRRFGSRPDSCLRGR